MSTLLNNNDIAKVLFLELMRGLPKKNKLPRLIVVQHFVPNSEPLFQALAQKFDVISFIPKPNSIALSTWDYLKREPKKYKIFRTTRDELGEMSDSNPILPIPKDNRPFIVLDVGGYFAKCSTKLAELFPGQLLGVVEDTENGEQKYLHMYSDKKETKFAVFSVARSPLKEPEDFLVGQSIVFSVESITRDNYSLLINRQVLVIGYGKIGRSIAWSLAVRNINVWVYDIDPIKQAQAMAHGFMVPERSLAIKNAGIIFGATGNKSLGPADFYDLKDYAFIASVTSADDEFEFGDIKSNFRTQPDPQEQMSIFSNPKNNKVFYLIRDGNAVNFVHNNALGVYIYLVACEIIACARKIIEISGQTTNKSFKAVQSLSEDERREVARIWKDRFFGKVFSL